MRFGGEHALPETSLSVVGGRPVVVSGRSGSGKSTLLRVLAGLLSPTTGAVRLWGASPSSRALARRRIGLTLDEPHLWPWMRARDAVVTLAGLGGASIRRPEADALLDELALGDAAGTRVSRLSQGMRRRVQLAGALAIGTDLLLLDEPTASLDDAVGGVVWDALQRRSAAGVPIVAASHDLTWRRHLQAEALELGPS